MIAKNTGRSITTATVISFNRSRWPASSPESDAQRPVVLLL
jgi:hypothetical protein